MKTWTNRANAPNNCGSVWRYHPKSGTITHYEWSPGSFHMQSIDSGGFQLWNNGKKAVRLHTNGVAEIVQASNSMEPGLSITGNGRIDLTRWKDNSNRQVAVLKADGTLHVEAVVANQKDWIPKDELKTLVANASDWDSFKTAINNL